MAEDERSAAEDEARFDDEGSAVGKPEPHEPERVEDAATGASPGRSGGLLSRLVDAVRGRHR